MKNISLFSFTLCLMVFTVCLGGQSGSNKPDGFFERMTGYKNPLRRKTVVVYPDGTEKIVYSKTNMKKVFTDCRNDGHCSDKTVNSYFLHNPNVDYNIEEGSRHATECSLTTFTNYDVSICQYYKGWPKKVFIKNKPKT